MCAELFINGSEQRMTWTKHFKRINLSTLYKVNGTKRHRQSLGYSWFLLIRNFNNLRFGLMNEIYYIFVSNEIPLCVCFPVFPFLHPPTFPSFFLTCFSLLCSSLPLPSCLMQSTIGIGHAVSVLQGLNLQECRVRSQFINCEWDYLQYMPSQPVSSFSIWLINLYSVDVSPGITVYFPPSGEKKIK